MSDEEKVFDVVEALRRKLAAAKDSSAFAWKNARTIDKARMETEEKLIAVTAERDAALRVTFDPKVLEQMNTLEQQLAASQAQKQQLLEALEQARLKWMGPYSSQFIYDALALPSDDTALKAWGAKLLRDAAGKMSIASDYAILFRMADDLEQTK